MLGNQNTPDSLSRGLHYAVVFWNGAEQVCLLLVITCKLRIFVKCMCSFHASGFCKKCPRQVGRKVGASQQPPPKCRLWTDAQKLQGVWPTLFTPTFPRRSQNWHIQLSFSFLSFYESPSWMLLAGRMGGSSNITGLFKPPRAPPSFPSMLPTIHLS